MSSIEVVARVLEHLSGHSASWWEFEEVLEVIGSSMSVDRVYVFENGFDPETGQLVASQRAEWCARGVSHELDNPELQDLTYDSLGVRWLEELSSGNPLQAKACDFSEKERAILGPQGIKSVLLVPVMIGGVWWGVIGFDQCSHEREWDEEAIRMLNLTGSLIASHLDRQRLRVNVEAAEKRSRFAMHVTGVTVWDYDVESKDMFIAAEFKDVLGHANEEIPNRFSAFLELVHADDRARVEDAVDRITSGRARFFEVEHRMLAKDGDVRWFLSRGSAILDVNDKPVRVIGTSMDVTDRKRSETAFRAIFEGSPDGMLLVDVSTHDGSWTIVDCNERAAVMHGCTRKDMVGRPVQGLLVNPPDAGAMAADLVRIRAAGVIDGESMHLRKDGSSFWCGHKQTLLNIDGRPRLLMMAQDVTERRRDENERIRAGKLEALGQLAGGIAHDFNNVLTAITGNLSLLRLEVGDNPSLNPLLDSMDQASGRARELAAQLLTFSRGGVPIVRVISLADPVRTAAHLATRGSRSKVVIDIAPDSPTVEADEVQISVMLRSIIINADQAMPEGGVIHVTMDRHIGVAGDKGGIGSFLRIRVSDTGCGIPEDIIGKIFDPYFSTKAQGSGLGLATAYSIANKHHATITVKSRPGEGTEFTILIPEKSIETEKAAAVQEESVKRKPRILVMDDEESIRVLAKRGLERFGYEVETAKDGEEAVAIYGEALKMKHPFAAVVLDMVIPGGFGGEKTIEYLRAIDPNVRAVAMSGYTTSGVLSNPGSLGFKAGLPKPFTLEKFTGTIAQVLKD